MMISNERGFIFIHVPKTGGTSISSVLLPFSDDKKVTVKHQDGEQRFGLIGDVTPHKHVTLQEYFDILGSDALSYRIIVTARHPFERAVSGYFSPHKWMQQDTSGIWQITEPFWDERRFFELLSVPNHRPATTWLLVDDHIVDPNFIVWHAQFDRHVRKLVELLQLPINPTIPKKNSTAAGVDLRNRVLSSYELSAEVERLYKVDMEYFGFTPYHKNQ
jgi:hypothetical protein